jgi:hypothetical protein
MATVMRSWDSEIQISHWSSPSYFNGTFSSWMSHPLEKPRALTHRRGEPAAAVVGDEPDQPSSRASSRKSCIFFWV